MLSDLGGGAAAPAEVKVRVRFSVTPVLDAGEGCSAWEAVQGLDGKWMPPAGRWLQFEVTLGTDNPLLSAALRSITVEAQTKPIGRLNPHAWCYEDLPQLERDADGEIVLLGPYDEPRREGHCLFCNFTLIGASQFRLRWVNISACVDPKASPR